MRTIPKTWAWVFLCALGLALGACGDDSASGGSTTEADPDVPDVVTSTVEDVSGPDTSGSEPGPDFFEAEDDVTIQCEDPPYGFGCPCEGNTDCESGWCIEALVGFVCTIPCLSTCPEGWGCKPVVGIGGDVAYVCLPVLPELCSPCTADQECGGPIDMCIPVGKDATLVCGAGCVDDTACPTGYVCKEATGTEGKTLKQCISSTDSCVCTADIDGTIEPCSVANEFGTCYGQRTCDGANGWTECSANVPAAEICDGLDNDCDGAADEDIANEPCVNENEFGSCDGTTACQGADGVYCAGQIPGVEACDGLDNNCNGEIDEGTGDIDDDGIPDCTDPDMDGDTDPNETDCAPTDPTIFTGAGDACDGIDNDCDGSKDEDYPDNDQDGAADCVDEDDDNDGILDGVDNCPFVANTDQTDTDNDGVGDACTGDADGDGIANEDDNCPFAKNPEQEDLDGDGLGDICDSDKDGDNTPNDGDCHPADPNSYPGAPEVCDGIDNDCDVQIDEPGADGCMVQYEDKDGDGFGSDVSDCFCASAGGWAPITGDCDDLNKNANPQGTEVCNGVDDDCDGGVDEDATIGCVNYYADADMDGYGVDGDMVCACQASGVYTATVGGDCNDADKKINPIGKEICNEVDEDCDGVADDGIGNPGCLVYFEDLDGDGFGNTDQAFCLCGPTDAFTATLPGDCDDADVDVSPGKPEQCDGTDTNCNGQVDEGCDDDKDGYCDQAMAVSNPVSCPNGINDCNDLAPNIHPAAVEKCDSLDNDCDGQVDEDGGAPCGGCAAVCQLGVGPSVGEPFDQTGANGAGVQPDGTVKLDASTLKFHMLWVANSGENTISKIDTETGKEAARYSICGNPSRTAVDQAGDCWVGCRADGKVAKIALEPSECKDNNNNGKIDTSTDLNGDGKITGAEMLPNGQDECVLLVVKPDSTNLARAVAVDKDNHAWVGYWDTRKVYRLNSTTGAVMTTVDFSSVTTARPYGFAIDKKGRLWVSMRDGSPPALGMIDLNSFPLTPKVWGTPGGHNTYGIAVDSLGGVWIASGENKSVSRFTPDTQAWKTVSLSQYPNTRGIAASTDGLVYVGHHNYNTSCDGGMDHYVSVMDAASGNFVEVINTATGNNNMGPVGMAIDFSDNLWAINQCASSATKIDRKTKQVIGHYPTGSQPYTYSDMTGFALKTVVAPSGTYVHTFKGWNGAPTQWVQITVAALTPPGTSIDVRYRTADSIAGLDASNWSASKGPFPPNPMPINLIKDGTISGAYMQVEVKLVSGSSGASPVLQAIDVVAAEGK